MDFQELEKFLTTLNTYEIKQQETGQPLNDLQGVGEDYERLPTEGPQQLIRFPKRLFFHGNDLYISRHNRFAPMPEHIHDFIEINYMYQGSCIQHINGVEVILKEQHVCILDRDVPHSIEALGEDDILINILINEKTFSNLFVFQVNQQNSLLANFLATTFNQQAAHDKYMHFDTQQAPFVKLQIQMMLIEYWSKQTNTDQFVNRYLQLILSELLRIFQNHQMANIKQFDYVKILNYIDEYSHEDIKLGDLASLFHYNPSYLSQSLKKYTGQSFQEILLQKRLAEAHELLLNSKLSISHISQVVGFHSTSYFFRQFKRRYGMTPKQVRTQATTQR